MCIHIWRIQELEIEKNKKKTMAFKMLIIAIIKVTIPFFLICQEEINVLQIVLYSWWMPIMRNVSFIIRVNMNCTMFYMEVLYCIKNVEIWMIMISCIPRAFPNHMKSDNANIKYHISETCTGSMSPNFKGVGPIFLLMH